MRARGKKKTHKRETILALRLKKLLTLQEAAESLSVSVSTLRVWCRGGALMVPVVRMGRDLRFDPDELWKWVKKRTEYPPRGKVIPFPWRGGDERNEP